MDSVHSGFFQQNSSILMLLYSFGVFYFFFMYDVLNTVSGIEKLDRNLRYDMDIVAHASHVTHGLFAIYNTVQVKKIE